MNQTLKFIGAALALALAAGCSTTPLPPMAPAPVRVSKSELPYHWSQGDAPRAFQQAVAQFGPLHLKPGQYLWTASIPDARDTHVVVDLMSQLFYVYAGDRLVGVSTISSGKKGKETPVGLWSVKIKKRLGYSRKYDNAPMPFMQMYDTAGIAFHAGKNPGYPASHGCIRLPLKFAERLYGMTTVGSKVIIEG
jgi:lipoprotein-anchoring transpeptidase ErfK/SrfK